MSNKDFDKLVNAAFGEADEATDKAIQDWLKEDAEAQEMHMQMASLNTGLKSLGDIPECQLTTDRLRDAILSQGVKPQPVKASWWKWAVPALTAACAGAFLFSGILNPDKTGSPTDSAMVAQNTATPATTTELTPEETMRELDSLVATNSGSARGAAASVLDRAVQLKSKVDSVEVASAPAVRTNTRRTTLAARSRADEDSKAVVDTANLVASNVGEAVSNIALFMKQPGDDVGARMAFGNDEPMSDAIPQAAESSSSKPQVVVLDGNIVPSTRAQGAVEIQKDDIVFGG